MLARPSSRQGGATLIELMIGLTVGLFMLAGASLLFVSYINGNRDLLLSTRLTQEMRAATSLIERDVRRAGFWQNAPNGVWYSGTSGVTSNPYAAVVATSGSSNVTYNYALDADDTVGSSEAFGFRMTTASGIGTLEMLKGGAWTALTNSDTTNVTAFSITPTTRTISLLEYCISPCPAGSTTCPPTMQVREYDLTFSAQSKSDSNIKRTIAESIRVRNDSVTGACPP